MEKVSLKSKNQANISKAQQVNRRVFLKTLGGAAALAGINALPGLSSVLHAAQIGGRIDFLSWEGYDLLNETKAWREKNGISIASTYIGSMEDTQAKLVGGAGVGYDLITYNQGYIGLYRKLGILTPLEAASMPNYPDIMPMWRKEGSSWVQDGKIWGVPFTWGAYTLTYNADTFKTPPKSWFDLLDKKYKGRIGIIDDMLIAVPVAAALAGFKDKLPNLSAQELKASMDMMKKFKAQARGIAPSYGELTSMFVGKEIVAAIPCWGAVALWAGDQGANIKNTLPDEGGFCFVDAYAVPPTVDNLSTTMAFINHVLSPEIQATHSKSLAGGIVNLKARPFLHESVKNLYDYDDLGSLFEKAPFTDLPPQESKNYTTYEDWVAAWEEFKVS